MIEERVPGLRVQHHLDLRPTVRVAMALTALTMLCVSLTEYQVPFQGAMLVQPFGPNVESQKQLGLAGAVLQPKQKMNCVQS